MADTSKPAGGTYTDQNAVNNQAAVQANMGAANFGQQGLQNAYGAVQNWNMPQVSSKDVTAALINRGGIRDVAADTRSADARLNAVMGQLGGASYYRPGVGIGDFLGYANPIMQLANSNFSPLMQGQMQTAGQTATQAARNLGGQFASKGALHSGAAMGAIGEAAARPYAEVANTLGMARTNLAGNLLNTAMPLTVQDQQFRTSAALQGAGLGMQGAGIGYKGAELGLQGQIANQGMDWNALNANAGFQNQAALANQQAYMQAQMANQNASMAQMQALGGLGSSFGSYGAAGLGGMASLGQSNYTYNPSAWDYAMQGVGAAGSLLGGIGSFF